MLFEPQCLEMTIAAVIGLRLVASSVWLLKISATSIMAEDVRIELLQGNGRSNFFCIS